MAPFSVISFVLEYYYIDKNIILINLIDCWKLRKEIGYTI